MKISIFKIVQIWLIKIIIFKILKNKTIIFPLIYLIYLNGNNQYINSSDYNNNQQNQVVNAPYTNSNYGCNQNINNNQPNNNSLANLPIQK